MVQNRIKPIEDSKKTIAAIVQDRIRDAILNGALTAGSRIDQAQLAADLNVSLVPVREALKKLEAEGFVQIAPRRGAFVTQTSIDDMEDLYFARTLLEGQAAYHAAERLTDDDLATLAALMPQMAEALETQNYARFTECNHRFHFTIYEAAGSRYLSNMITSLWELAERYRFRYVFLHDQATVIQDEHQQILDACRARKKDQLRDAIAYHMHQTMVGVKGYILSRQAERHKE
jgi:DNA-binding GntR family transcriptional regulator